MRFARWVFGIAGVYGIVGLVPALFAEGRIGAESPPAITHPEFFYGFIGSALVWQLLFLLIARDPRRYQPLMLVAVGEKLAYFVPCVLLYASGRMAAGGPFLGGMIDGGLMLLFAAAWWRTRGQA